MADKFSSVQRTFPKKTTFSNNSKLKKGKWKKGQEKYNQFISGGNKGDRKSDEAGVKSKQQSKNGKTERTKKRMLSIAENAGEEAKESLIGGESDSNYISAENIEAVARSSGNLPSNAHGRDRHFSDEGKLMSVGSKNPIDNIMISSASEDEGAGLENAEFREEIAKIPLGKAKQLRDRLGKKLFDRAFFDDDPSSSPNMKPSQRVFVRENPKRPREVSSKRPVSKFRNVFENEKLERTVCDPRFDNRCGEFNDYIYHNNYSFLDEIREREKKILMKELKNASDDMSVNKNKLKEALKKMKNQEKTQADVNRRKEVVREIRHENNERMRQGLPPVFRTRAQIRELIWRKKYDDLKGGDKLKKYLHRKMKKQDKKRNGFSGSVSCEDKPLSFPSE